MWQKLLAVILAILGFNLFFYTFFPVFNLGSLGFLLLLSMAQLVLHLAYFSSNHSLKRQVAYGCSVLAIVAGSLSVFRANPVDQFFLWILSGGLSLVAWYLLALKHHHFGAVSELLIMPLQLGFGWLFTAFQQLEQSPSALSRVTSRLKHSSKPGLINPRILRGILIAVPIVLLIIMLLKSADPIFDSLVSRLFSWNLSLPDWLSQVTGRIVATLAVIVLVVPAINLVIEDRFISPFRRKIWGKFSVEAAIVVGAVALVLAVFLAIQFRYLFASVSETQLHQFGIQTYSEYVRKGFSELLIVAGLLYSVVGLSLVVLRMSETEPKYLRSLNLALLVEGLVFVFSIFRRVLLYQADHGLTRIRVYGLVFLLTLMALTMVLMLRHLVKRRIFWGAIEVGVVVLGLFLAVTLNIDKLIATSFKPTVNHEIDYSYIAQLSADGVDGWLEAYEHSRSVVENSEYQAKTTFSDDEARRIMYAIDPLWSLSYNYSSLTSQYGTAEALSEVGVTPSEPDNRDDSLSSYLHTNLAERRAYELLTEKLPYGQFNQTRLKAEALYNLLSDDQKYQVYDRSFDRPLLD